MTRKPRINTVLWGACAVLALLLAARAGQPGLLARADAVLVDPPEKTAESPFNAAEQRKQMIIQLTEMNRRLAAIENKINSGLSVKVTEMPAVQIKPDPAKKD